MWVGRLGWAYTAGDCPACFIGLNTEQCAAAWRAKPTMRKHLLVKKKWSKKEYKSWETFPGMIDTGIMTTPLA
jgi:hypothetical protein